MHAARHPVYRERYQRTKRRLGRQRGAKVAQVDIARELAEAIWHMLTRNEPFAPGRRRFSLWPPDGPLLDLRRRSEPPIRPGPPSRRR